MPTLHIELREGFQGHTVHIAVDGRAVYERGAVTTPADGGSCADTIDVPVDSRLTHVRVSVVPGDLVVAFRTDVSLHPYVTISLVSERTVSCQTSARPVPRSLIRRGGCYPAPHVKRDDGGETP